MILIDELRAEHELIDGVLGSFRTFAAGRARGEADPRDGDGFLRFFRVFSGGYHHAREEEILLPALTAEAGLDAKSGPVISIVDQHRSMALILEELSAFLTQGPGTTGRMDALVEQATRCSRALWLHIDAENSVLFPESEQRLRRAGVHELPGRPMSVAERDARSEGERLARLYPETYDPGAIRGEGCVICPSYGSTCEGVEREWWNEWEWEMFDGRQG